MSGQLATLYAGPCLAFLRVNILRIHIEMEQACPLSPIFFIFFFQKHESGYLVLLKRDIITALKILLCYSSFDFFFHKKEHNSQTHFRNHRI